MEFEKIKPCPFCGSDADVDSRFVAGQGSGHRFIVQCNERQKTCLINMRTHKKETIAEAISAWNHRTPAKNES